MKKFLLYEYRVIRGALWARRIQLYLKKQYNVLMNQLVLNSIVNRSIYNKDITYRKAFLETIHYYRQSKKI